METNLVAPDFCIGIVGTGAMGRGIAQIAAQAGIHVKLHDAMAGAAANARATVVATLEQLVAKGKLDATQLAAATSRLEIVNGLTALAPCSIVIEAIVENLDMKRQLFQQLEDIVGGDCILATNTSSLSVTAIAAACMRPERVAGFHFFNPVPLMKIVEVIDGLLTSSGVIDTLVDVGERMGHSAVRAKDTPGFIVNHAGRGFTTEALRVLGEGVATVADIDRIMRDAAGFRMGPFELLDLTGLDVSQPVMESIYHQFYEEPRFRPSPLAAQRLAGGVLGRKTNRGFYIYEQNRPIYPPEAPVPSELPGSVWLGAVDHECVGYLATIATDADVSVESGPTPSSNALCIVTPFGRDATTEAIALGLDPARTVAIDALFALAKGRRRHTLMTTPLTSPLYRNTAHALLSRDGSAVSVIRDSAGLVAQRILACIVNIGCDIAQQRIAAPTDIDRAVRLGLGYPNGPLGLGDAIGAKRVLAILEGLQAFYGDPRYRPSPWLKRRALLRSSLLTDEA